MTTLHRRFLIAWAVPALCLAVGSPLFAADGVIEINQAKALAGGLTAGDTPGFPVTISVAGSYILTSDLARSGTVIDITTGNVALDLNGFTITNSGSSVTVTVFSARLVRITNGTIVGGTIGVDFETNTAPGTIATHQLDHVVLLNQTSANSSEGALYITGNGATFTHVIVSDNTIVSAATNGIRMTDIGGGQVTNNSLRDNANSGLRVESALGVEISGNIAMGNTDGILLANNSELNVHHNTCSSNSNGIRLTGGSGVTNTVLDWNTCANNNFWGIQFSMGSTGNIYSHNRTPGNGMGGIDQPGGNTDGGNNFN